MAYQKILLNSMLIDQIVYEIITNSFTQPQISLNFIPLIKLSKMQTSQNSFHCNFFSINFKNMFEKKNFLYKGREK